MDLLTGTILAFVMVLTRVTAFFATAPIFSWQGLPVRVKLGLALFISAFISMQLPAFTTTAPLSAPMAILLLSNELIYGVALGMICFLLFTTIKVFARIAETQMGLNMAATFDPLSGEQAQPLSIIVEMCFILIFLAANGHHMLLLTLSKSYEKFPPGSIPKISIMLESVAESGTVMLTEALRMAGPILAAFILMLLVLAIFARIAPEMNILFLSMPVRVAVGIGMMALFIPYTQSFVQQLAKLLDHYLPI